MTPTEKRIKIAQACGWKLHSSTECWERWYAPDGALKEALCYNSIRYPFPDYFASLDAMHEAEKILNDTQNTAYNKRLTAVTDSSGQNYIPSDGVLALYGNTFARVRSATAAQRAEAFGQALNLWI